MQICYDITCFIRPRRITHDNKYLYSAFLWSNSKHACRDLNIYVLDHYAYSTEESFLWDFLVILKRIEMFLGTDSSCMDREHIESKNYDHIVVHFMYSIELLLYNRNKIRRSVVSRNWCINMIWRICHQKQFSLKVLS